MLHNKEINTGIQNFKAGKNFKDYLVQAQLENLRPREVKSFTQVHRKTTAGTKSESSFST